jgi:hypothetical protein
MRIFLSVVSVILLSTIFVLTALSQETGDKRNVIDGNLALRSNDDGINRTLINDAVEIYYYFEVSESTNTDTETKLEINPSVPDGLIYRIQVAVFRNPVTTEFFKGIVPVYGYRPEGSDLNKYYVGMFRRFSDARNALEEVREIGFKDSFIASFEGNKPISVSDAAILEKEWGKKPFERIELTKPAVIPADTLAQKVTVEEEAVSAPESEKKQDTLRANAVKIFVDCRSCDMNYTRQEIPFVNYVRDTREAEVYLLVTNEGTGSGGTRFTFAFQGLGKYSGMNDTLLYTSNPDETGAIIREKKTHMIKMGLMRYVARTPLFDEVNIKNNGEIKQQQTEDKWNNWVFMLQTNPQFNSEETYSRVALYNSFEISKVTPEIKLESEISYFNNKQKFIEGEVVSEYLIKSRSMQNLFVKSMGNHWSGGLRLDMESSTSMNYDFNIDFLPSIEYDIYPYSEATHRQFRIMYSIGYEYSDFTDTTIYNKMTEGLFKHSLRAAYQIQKKWGSINLSASGSNYLDDFSKNRFGFWGYTRLRIVKGLALSVNAGVTYVNNQMNLAKGELSEAERLLRLKQQATSFYLNGGCSLSYTFGSIYNNVVNPRFGNNNNNNNYY